MLVEENGVFRFEIGSMVLAVDASLGGRIVRFALDHHDVLSGPDIHPTNFGSTFWPSPQSDWGWPPPAEIDSAPYRVVSQSDAHLALESTVCPALSLSVTKTFTSEPERGCVSIEYAIINRGDVPRSVAPWEITRVPTGGLTFYPTGGAVYRPDGIVPLHVRDVEGTSFFSYDASLITGDQKWFADGAGGWLAHLAGAHLFVKSFADTTPEERAPGEGEIEIYADGAHRYVEIEQQGKYASIAAGDAARWTVRWYLTRAPAGHRGVESGNELVRCVEKLLGA